MDFCYRPLDNIPIPFQQGGKGQVRPNGRMEIIMGFIDQDHWSFSKGIGRVLNLWLERQICRPGRFDLTGRLLAETESKKGETERKSNKFFYDREAAVSFLCFHDESSLFHDSLLKERDQSTGEAFYFP